MTVRVSTGAGEVLADGAPAVRISQAVLEVATDGASGGTPPVRLSQAMLEVLVSMPRPAAIPPLQLRRLRLRRLT